MQITFQENSNDPRNYKVDFSKIEKKLKFKAKYPVSFGIDEIIENFNLFKNKNKKLFGNYEI